MSVRQRIFICQALCAMLMFFTAFTAFGYVQLHNGSAFVFWNLPGNNQVTYTINSAGSDDISDKSEALAIRMAFEAWNNAPESRIKFVEDSSHQNSTNVGDNKSHLILFDENNSTGFFPSNSGVVAITPIASKPSTGEIIDADIVVNGRDHKFSTNGKNNTFDVQSIITHEVGHFLGLDHTGIRTATMYPFADVNEYHLRSLTSDDRAGVGKLYPSNVVTNSISGQVTLKSNDTTLNGVHVVALSTSGKVVSSTITDSNGEYTLSGLSSGNYYVYAEPLDGPVLPSSINLKNIDTNFATQFYGGNNNPSAVSAGTSNINILMPPVNNLNLLEASPVQVNPGSTLTFYFKAQNFSITKTDLKFSHPDILPIGAATAANSSGWYKISLSVGSSVAPGVYNVQIQEGKDVAALTGGLEVVLPEPTFSSVSPANGAKNGGDTVTIDGGNFQSGAKVIFGDQIASNVTWLDSNTLSVVTPAHSSTGTVSITIQNPDGQFVLGKNAFDYVDGPPSITSLTPSQGATAGGTKVTIKGQNFSSGASVTFGGKSGQIISIKADEILCETPSHSTGPQDVTVTNPGGISRTLSGGFTYIEPSILSIQPEKGQASGDTQVLIKGEGFDPKGQVEILFGGSQAQSVSVLDEETLYCTTPSGVIGSVDVKVTNTRDGASAFRTNGFEYVSSPDPVISSVQPTSGPSTGGTEVTIKGQNFSASATVFIGGRQAQILALSFEEIVIRTPAGNEGGQLVAVKNPNGQEALRVDGFSYFSLAPAANTGGGGGGGGCTLVNSREISTASVWGTMLPVVLLLSGLFILRRKEEVF